MLDDRSKLACGCYEDETVGPDAFDRFTVEPVICERHRMIGEAAERWAKQANEADPRHGLLWRARRDPD